MFKFDKRTNSCPPKYFEILNKTVNLPFDATMIFHMQIVLDKSLLNDAIHISILQISWFQRDLFDLKRACDHNTLCFQAFVKPLFNNLYGVLIDSLLK